MTVFGISEAAVSRSIPDSGAVSRALRPAGGGAAAARARRTAPDGSGVCGGGDWGGVALIELDQPHFDLCSGEMDPCGVHLY